MIPSLRVPASHRRELAYSQDPSPHDASHAAMTIWQRGGMIDIGEDLVGAYLNRVVGCSVVQFNVRTLVRQAEIDVVGLKINANQISDVWLCEVSTHTGGLGGYKGNAAGKIAAKIASVKAYASSTYPGVRQNIEVWSPKVTPGMMSKLGVALVDHPDVTVICNHEYAQRVRELAALARTQTAYSDSPSFRLLQILSRLPSSPL